MSLPAEPIIDVWVQHPTSDFLRDPLFDTLRRWMHLTEVPPTISPQLTLGALEAAHVQTAIVTASWGPRGPLLSNDEVAAFCRLAPGRLAGAAAVDLHWPMDAVRELRRCVKELGFVALRMLPWLWGLPPPYSIASPASRRSAMSSSRLLRSQPRARTEYSPKGKSAQSMGMVTSRPSRK